MLEAKMSRKLRWRKCHGRMSFVKRKTSWGSVIFISRKWKASRFIQISSIGRILWKDKRKRSLCWPCGWNTQESGDRHLNEISSLACAVNGKTVFLRHTQRNLKGKQEFILVLLRVPEFYTCLTSSLVFSAFVFIEWRILCVDTRSKSPFISSDDAILVFHVTSSPPCWCPMNKWFLISVYC
jgi:hypothetical protein